MPRRVPPKKGSLAETYWIDAVKSIKAAKRDSGYLRYTGSVAERNKRIRGMIANSREARATFERIDAKKKK